MSEKLIFNCTYGKEDPERATLPFVAANIAATAGAGIRRCLHDRRRVARHRRRHGGHRLRGAVRAQRPVRRVRDNGGQLWLCGACTKPRGITEEQVSKGATIVGAAKVVEEVVAGAKTVAFA